MARKAPRAGKAKAKKKMPAADPSQKRLRIPSRQIVGHDIHDIKVSTPIVVKDASSVPQSADQQPVQSVPSKRPVIVPISDDAVADTAKLAASKRQAAPAPRPAAAAKLTPKASPAAPGEASSKQSAPASDPAAEESPADLAGTDAPANPETDTLDDDIPADDPSRPSAETQQALREAEAAAKREQELQSYIDSRQFFVPINAVARKRSIMVSAGLTLLVLLLALVLIDLMLDSGVILLLQKIPHTHFFSLGN